MPIDGDDPAAGEAGYVTGFGIAMMKVCEMVRPWDLACAGAVAVAVGGGMIVIGYPPSLSLVSSYLGAAMMLIALVDRRLFLIPDIVVLPTIPIGLIASGSLVSPWADALAPLDSLAGVLVGPLVLLLVRWIYSRLRGREGLGLGDVKLIGAAGAWVGLSQLPLVVLIASLGALLAVAGRSVVSRRRGDDLGLASAIPFGLFLAPAIWLVWMTTMVAAREWLGIPG